MSFASFFLTTIRPAQPNGTTSYNIIQQDNGLIRYSPGFIEEGHPIYYNGTGRYIQLIDSWYEVTAPANCTNVEFQGVGQSQSSAYNVLKNGVIIASGTQYRDTLLGGLSYASVPVVPGDVVRLQSTSNSVFFADQITFTIFVPTMPVTVFDPNYIAGLRLGLLPSGLVSDGNNRVTGWKNEATQAVLNADGLYTAADADFNGKATQKLEGNGGAYGYMGGVNLGAVTDGITVVVVAKGISLRTADWMWWYLNAGGVPLDLWNRGGNNMTLNTFGGTGYGISPSVPPITDTLIITTVVTNNDTVNSQIYINGVLQTFNFNTGGLSNLSFANADFFLGRCMQSENYNFDGKFSTALVYNHKLTNDELEYLHYHLQTTYNIGTPVVPASFGAPTPANFHTVGAYLDDNAAGVFTYGANWIVYTNSDYLNNGCHYLDQNSAGAASLNLPVKGNALRYSTGSNTAGRGVVVETRPYTTNGTGTWSTLGTFTGPGAPQTISLPTTTGYYDVRFSNMINGQYTVIDVIEVV